MTATDVSTRQRLDDAMRDYIAEIGDGAILTDWFLITAATTVEDIGAGRTIYSWVQPPTQPPHVSLGLLAYASENATTVDDDD